MPIGSVSSHFHCIGSPLAHPCLASYTWQPCHSGFQCQPLGCWRIHWPLSDWHTRTRSMGFKDPGWWVAARPQLTIVLAESSSLSEPWRAEQPTSVYSQHFTELVQFCSESSIKQVVRNFFINFQKGQLLSKEHVGWMRTAFQQSNPLFVYPAKLYNRSSYCNSHRQLRNWIFTHPMNPLNQYNKCYYTSKDYGWTCPYPGIVHVCPGLQPPRRLSYSHTALHQRVIAGIIINTRASV